MHKTDFDKTTNSLNYAYEGKKFRLTIVFKIIIFFNDILYIYYL